MASSDNHQWGYPQYTQPSGPGTGQGDFMSHTFQRDGDEGSITGNAFGLSHQWQTPQDNHFIQQNGFYQPQAQGFSAQQFPAGNTHIQSHQHPQAFSGPISLDGPSDIPWDYDFSLETNPLAGLGDDGIPYGNALQQGSNPSGVSGTSSFPQDISNAIPAQHQHQHQNQHQHQHQQHQHQPRQQQHHQQQQQQQQQHHQQQQQQQQQQPQPQPQPQRQSQPQPQQHQANTGPSSTQMYTHGQVATYGRNTPQSQPQTMAQTINHRQAMDFQQPMANQQQHQPVISQHQHTAVTQHQHPAVTQHQHPNTLQAVPQQPNQVQSLNHQQQIPRIGTPQSVTPSTQPRHSPFNGRNVPPLPMQQPIQQPQIQQPQQGQFSAQDARGSPFPVAQQTSVPKASASLANVPTTQSRFVPQQLAATQRPSQSPIPSINNVSSTNIMPRMQQPGFQPTVQQNAIPNSHPRMNVPMPLAVPLQQPLTAPRIIRRDDNTIPTCGTRYVGFNFAPSLPINPDADENKTTDDIVDPNEEIGEPFGRVFPGQNGQMRIMASHIVQNWAKALVQGDAAEQSAQEQQLKQHLGGFIPRYYEDKLQNLKTLYQKSLVRRGPDRSKARPGTEADAAEWDALGIVYLASPQPTGSEIGTAVASYGKLIRGHTAEFQKLKQKLKTANEAESAVLKEQISRKLQTIHRAVAATNTWGDPQVVANLGGNQKLISDFVTCLIHANNSGDHNGPLPKDVLRLMSQVTTIEKDFLMTSLQFAKISKKFESKGDAEVKSFVKTIKENAETRDESLKVLGSGEERTSTPEHSASLKNTPTSNSMDIKTTGPTDPAKKKIAGPAAARAASITSSTKRPRDDDSDTKSAKRVAADTSSSQTSQPAPKPAPSKVVVSVPNPSGAKLFGSGILGNKAKPIGKPIVKVVPTKADGPKPELSATKMEIKKEPTKISKPDVLKTKKAEPFKVEPSTASKLGGIGALLDEISNSKPKQTGRSTPDKESKVDKDETPEEKTRRLRKEKRRHLRVSWKEGDELTEVRIFHKDVGEDEGRASNMIRDARDDRSEGMVLKQGVQIDEDDDEDELPYRPWFQPTGIDFGFIPQDHREKSFVTRGGQLEFETQQQKFIAERENTELMVVYTDPSDIPSTPKSPHSQPQDDTDMHSGTVYNLVQDDTKLAEVHLRWVEAGSRGLSWARLNALRRAQKGQTATLSDVSNIHSVTQPTISSAPSGSQAPPMSREDRAFTLLLSDRVKQYKDPEPYDPANPKTQRRHDYASAELQRAVDLVETVAEQLRGKPFPPTEPPEWIKNDSQRVAEWWHGYNKDMQRAQQQDQQQQQQQQQVIQAAQQAPVGQLQAVPQAASQVAQSAMDPNAAAWAAYYAQLQQQGQAQPHQYAQAYGDVYTAYLQSAQAAQQQQATPAQTAADPNAQLQAVLAALGAAPTQSQQQAVPAQNSTDPQLQALLASLAGTTAQHPTQTYQPQPAQAQAQAQAPNPNDPDYMAYIMSLATGQAPGQGEQQAQPQQQQALNINGRERGTRKRDRDRDEETETVHPSRRDKNRNQKTNKADVPAHLRGINREKIGTKPCTFWAKGMCQKGDQCTFRHD